MEPGKSTLSTNVNNMAGRAAAGNIPQNMDCRNHKQPVLPAQISQRSLRRHSRISRHQAEEKSKEEGSGKANPACCGLNTHVPRAEVSCTCKAPERL